MVSRSTGRLRFHPLETQFSKIQFIDEDVDQPDRVILRDVVVEPLGNNIAWERSSPSTYRFMTERPVRYR